MLNSIAMKILSLGNTEKNFTIKAKSNNNEDFIFNTEKMLSLKKDLISIRRPFQSICDLLKIYHVTFSCQLSNFVSKYQENTTIWLE